MYGSLDRVIGSSKSVSQAARPLCRTPLATARARRRHVAAQTQQAPQEPRAAQRAAAALAAAALLLQQAAPAAAAAEYQLGAKELFSPMAYSGRCGAKPLQQRDWHSCVCMSCACWGVGRGSRLCRPRLRAALPDAARPCGALPRWYEVASLKKGFAGEGQQDCHCTQVGGARRPLLHRPTRAAARKLQSRSSSRCSMLFADMAGTHPCLSRTCAWQPAPQGIYVPQGNEEGEIKLQVRTTPFQAACRHARAEPPRPQQRRPGGRP